MSTNSAALVFYAVFAIVYPFACIHNFVYCDYPGSIVYESTKQKLQYLTTWDTVLQSVYFVLSALNAVRGFNSKENNTALNRLCNRLYVSLVFPIGMMVCVLFWAVWSIDRELVFPRAYDEIIPNWQNHAMHTLPFVTTLIDSYLTRHKYPRFIDGVKLPMLFVASYLGLTFYIAYVHGIWLYPLLKVMSFQARMTFFAVFFTIISAVYKAGQLVNESFWPQRKAHKMK